MQISRSCLPVGRKSAAARELSRALSKVRFEPTRKGGRVIIADFDCDHAHRIVCIHKKVLCAFHTPQRQVCVAGRAKVLLEECLELADAQTGDIGQDLNRMGDSQVLFHQKDGPHDPLFDARREVLLLDQSPKEAVKQQPGVLIRCIGELHIGLDAKGQKIGADRNAKLIKPRRVTRQTTHIGYQKSRLFRRAVAMYGA